jgi:hypothetical protein
MKFSEMNSSYNKKSETKCKLCGKSIESTTCTMIENLDGTTFVFDTIDCKMIFMRLQSLYGNNFSMEE